MNSVSSVRRNKAFGADTNWNALNSKRGHTGSSDQRVGHERCGYISPSRALCLSAGAADESALLSVPQILQAGQSDSVV
jgi:hypothetical protein